MVTRHIVAPAEQAQWLELAERALAALAGQPGYVSGEIAAAADQADLLVITTHRGGPRRGRSASSDSAGLSAQVGSAFGKPPAASWSGENHGF